MKLAKAMATVAGLTGISRVAGFVRDIFTAAILGAGPVADAFFVALKLPNFFRRITAEGAFSVSFVPVYTAVMEKEGEKAASDLASNTFTIMACALSLFVLLTVWAMPWVIYGVAPGFAHDPERYTLAVEMASITFPYLLFMSLTAMVGAALNAVNRFAPFAIAPVLFNVCMITALLFSDLAKTAGHAMAVGVFVAGILQLVWLLLSARRAKLEIRLVKPRFDVHTKKILALMGPGVVGAGMIHINLFADVMIASLLDAGSISYMYYADRLNQLPLGMVGIAVGTALLPMLSRAIAAQNAQESSDLFNRALEYCLLLAFPAATGLLALGWPIVVTLFHHGAFTAQAAQSTAAVLMAYCVGLPAYVAAKVFMTAFWARQDTMTPVKISIIATVFNIAVSLGLVFFTDIGVAGIALATSLAGWLQIAFALYYLRGRADTRFDAQFIRNALKIVGSCALMYFALYFMQGFLGQYYDTGLEDPSKTRQILGLGVLVGGGGVLYSVAIVASGVVPLREIKALLSKLVKKKV